LKQLLLPTVLEEIMMAPDESKPTPKGKIRDVALWSLFVAAAGVIAPIILGHYQNSAELTLKEKSSTAIINLAHVPEDLAVTYAGVQIQNLTTIGFELSNTGNKPIQAGQLIEIPRITFRNSARVLSAHIDSAFPPDVEAVLNTTPDKSSVAIEFPLLNVGDRVSFSVLVDQASPTYRTSARIVGIRELTFAKAPPRAKLNLGSVSWGSFIVLGATSFCFLILIVGGMSLAEERRTNQLWKARLIRFPKNVSSSTFRKYFDELFRGIKIDSERAPIRQLLDALPPEKLFSDADNKRLETEIGKALASFSVSRTMLLLIGVLACIGSGYIFHELFLAIE
jgi:hypothetical protein